MVSSKTLDYKKCRHDSRYVFLPASQKLEIKQVDLTKISQIGIFVILHIWKWFGIGNLMNQQDHHLGGFSSKGFIFLDSSSLRMYAERHILKDTRIPNPDKDSLTRNPWKSPDSWESYVDSRISENQALKKSPCPLFIHMRP